MIPRPENLPLVSPYVVVQDVDKALKFYEGAFGFKKLSAVPGDDGITVHAEVDYEGQHLMFGRAGAYGGKSESPVKSRVDSPISLYVYCKDVDSFHQKAVSAGAVSVSAPEDSFWGDRMCRVQDPDGYVWAFATYGAPKSK